MKYYSEEAINCELKTGNLYDVLYDNNKEHLDEIAIEYFNKEISYKELFDNIRQTEKAFRSIGVKQGEIVILSMVTTPELIYSFYALARLGAVANIIDPRLEKTELIRMVEETHSHIIMCVDLVAEHISKSLLNYEVTIVAISPGESFSGIYKLGYQLKNKTKVPKGIIQWKDFIAAKDIQQERYDNVLPENVVLMTHTSGTTGKSKGVMLSHNNINAVAMQYRLGMEHRRQQKYMVIIPPFIAFGICVAIHLPLCLGMICIPIPKFEVASFYNLLKKYKPNHFTCTPSNLEYLSNDRRRINLSMLMVPSVGGDYISWKTEEKINSYLKKHGVRYELVKGYGMTEVSSSACTTKNGYNKPGSVGFPLAKMTISIFEPETDRELKYNEEGEICFTGPNIMLGYYNNAEATSATIRVHCDGKRWVHSGDVGYMDKDGFLYVIDRMKRIIHLSNGVMLLPSKIERCILELNQVSSCAVIGHMYGNEVKARAYVTIITEIKEKEIISYCRSNLPENIMPQDIVFIDKLPLTPVGKIDYIKLEKMDKAD